MSRSECDRQYELAELAMAGGWPHRADPELAGHVRSCAECAELALVAGTIATDRDDAIAHASIPTSGVMWWKAQRRARLEAAAAATRTVTAAQVVLTVAGVLLALGALRPLLAGAGWQAWLERGAGWLSAAIVIPHLSLTVVVAILACFALAPIALVIATRE